MKLILVRHAQTEGNVKRVLEGPDGRLTAYGVEQARLLARRLKQERIDVIYSSPFQRAKQTASFVKKFHPKARIFYVPHLHEQINDKYRGRSIDAIDWDRLPRLLESRQSMYRRAKRFLAEIYPKNKGKTVLVVSHNALNKALIRVLLHKPINDKTNFKQDNVCVNIFELKEDGQHKICLLNCTKHLDCLKQGHRMS